MSLLLNILPENMSPILKIVTYIEYFPCRHCKLIWRTNSSMTCRTMRLVLVGTATPPRISPGDTVDHPSLLTLNQLEETTRVHTLPRLNQCLFLVLNCVISTFEVFYLFGGLGGACKVVLCVRERITVINVTPFDASQ